MWNRCGLFVEFVMSVVWLTGATLSNVYAYKLYQGRASRPINSLHSSVSMLWQSDFQTVPYDSSLLPRGITGRERWQNATATGEPLTYYEPHTFAVDAEDLDPGVIFEILAQFRDKDVH